jgi:L-xylulose reductase
LQEATEELVDSILNVNFKGQLWMCKHTLPKMKNGSCIVNVASIAALKSYIGLGIYCASKAAIVSMTKTLALEVAERKIRVNAIAP